MNDLARLDLGHKYLCILLKSFRKFKVKEEVHYFCTLTAQPWAKWQYILYKRTL